MKSYFTTLFIMLLAFTQFACTTNSAHIGPSISAQTLINELGLKEEGKPSADHPRWKQPDVIYVALPPFLKAQTATVLSALQRTAGDIPVKTLAINTMSVQERQSAEVVIGYCYSSLLEKLPNLVWVQNLSAGVERCLAKQSAKDADFILTNAQHMGSPAIAEHSIGMMLMLTRNLHTYHRQQFDKKWRRQFGPQIANNELQNKTLLILGLGGIGDQIAKRAHALGMRVIATRNSSKEGPAYVDYVGLSNEMFEMAERADIVVNALPLTSATYQIVDKNFFAKLKPTSFYLSVGRGKTTDQAALINALSTNAIAGAGLDVTDPEPLPQSSPLWTLENVIITPHTSAYSMGTTERSLILQQENLRRYLQGEKLLNVVDKQRGY